VTTSRLRAVLAVLLLAAASAAAASDMRAEMAVRDSLRIVAPSHRAKWLQARGLGVSEFLPTYRPDSSNGLRLVGKYGRGPALSVTGQDSLVFVAMGSEVAVVDAAIPSIPHVLAEIQLGFLPSRVRVSDSLLLVCGAAVELWSIATPSQPRFISRLPMPVYDFCIRDSLLFLMSRDTFMVYNIAAPASPQRLGAYPDSGYATTMAGNTVVIMLASGLGFVDVSNPASPHRVGSYGGYLWSACARGSICCMTAGNPNQPTWLQLQVIDISDPASAFPLGSLDSAGGYDLAIEDSMLYASGYYTGNHEFQIISLGDSAHPRRVGACLTYGENCGVWVDAEAQHAYVADRHMGLSVIDATVPTTPVVDTAILRADMAMDVSVRGGLAFVADYRAGLKVLDVTQPEQPAEIGLFDTLSSGFTAEAVAASDSFAFASWWPQSYFRSIDVSDPTRPSMAGGCTVFDQPQSIILRDTLAYLAERLRFHIINVARPREPVLVGSCVLPSDVMDLDLEDSLAFVTTLPFSIVNVARPNSPVLVGSSNVDASGVDAVDTIAYITAPYTGVVALNVARPAQPTTIDSLYLPNWWNDVVVVGSRAYVGGTYIKVVDISDPTDLRVIGSWTPPYLVRRLCYSAPYLYAACYDAGVCVLESTAVGVSETPWRDLVNRVAILAPNPTSGRLEVSLGGRVTTGGAWTVRDVAGRLIRSGRVAAGQSRFSVDLTSEPSGVYMVELEVTRHRYRGRVVKF
jgi:hypothetical protein